MPLGDDGESRLAIAGGILMEFGAHRSYFSDVEKQDLTAAARMSFLRHLVESALFALLAVLLLGCNKAENTAAAENVTTTNFNGRSGIAEQDVNGSDIREGAGARTPGDNGNLDERIRAALESDPAFAADADRVRILVVNGRIILSGSVSSTAERENIEERVRQMAGDTLIENRLRVETVGP